MIHLESLQVVFIIFFSGFSSPRAIAGNESVTKFINNNCNVVNGFDQFANTANTIAIIPPKFPENKYVIDFFILSYTVLPDSTSFNYSSKVIIY